MKSLRSHLFAAAVAVAALAVAVPAQAQSGNVNIRIPLTQTISNPCTNEAVTLSGTLVGHANVRQTAANTFDVNARVNATSVSGTGTPSGATYRGSGQASFRGTFTGFPINVTTRFRLSRQGQGGDARGTAVIRIDRAADETFSASLVSVDADCRPFREMETDM